MVVTTKKVNYHQPARHLSRLRLVVTDDGSYYIQVLGECCHIIVCVYSNFFTFNPRFFGIW